MIMATIIVTCAPLGARVSGSAGAHCNNIVRAMSMSASSVVATSFIMPGPSARFAQHPRKSERLLAPIKFQPSISLPISNRSCTLHSTTSLLASKRNGGRSKKAKLKSMDRTEPDADEDGNPEQTLVDTDKNMNNSLEREIPTEFNATFASEYHAPVMPTECVNALLQQGEWGELLRARKERMRKKRSILEAKRRRSMMYDDDDDNDIDSEYDGEDEEADADNGDADSGAGNFEEKGDSLPFDLQSTGNDLQQRPRLFIDGTLGGGGHSQALLQQLRAGDILIGCDVDPEALSTASTRLSEYLSTCEYILETITDSVKPECGWKPEKPMFIPVQSNFRDLITILSKLRHPVTGRYLLGDRKRTDDNEVEFPRGSNGMLLDLGVSSHQINTSERGFAFMKEGPLDMRMGNSQTSVLTAADICNEFDESTIIDILRTYGDEPRAKRIASAIVASRPLHTTTDLVHAINSVTPTFARQKRAGLIATSARVFQALRIVVNEEDSALKEVLERVAPWALARCISNRSTHLETSDDGILAVLSYHSMEDKMAKRVMRDGKVDLSKGDSLERDVWGNMIGDDTINSTRPFEPLTKPKNASDEEVAVNSRSRSATLRVAIRI